LRIVGIDPGTITAGWGVVDCEAGRASRAVAWGAIRAPKKDPVPERLATIARGLDEVLREHSPEVASIEEAFYGESAQSALRIGEARGAAIVACRLRDVRVEQFTPAEVKKAVTGNGRAHKSQVARMVKTLLNLDEEPTPADAADALAVALALCHRL